MDYGNVNVVEKFTHFHEQNTKQDALLNGRYALLRHSSFATSHYGDMQTSCRFTYR